MTKKFIVNKKKVFEVPMTAAQLLAVAKLVGESTPCEISKRVRSLATSGLADTYFGEPNRELGQALAGQIEADDLYRMFTHLGRMLREAVPIAVEVDNRPTKVYVNYYITNEGEIIRGRWAFKDSMVALRCSKEADSHPIGISTEKYDPSIHKFKGE